ncbi:MAG TPA: glycosyltransferase family 1 protein [Thermoleophilaceae bacterium]
MLTLFPGRVGGSETNVRGLLGAFAAGQGPDEVVVLANRHVVGPYAGFQRGPVRIEHVRSYRSGDSEPTRLAAMTFAALAPGRVARDMPAGLDVVHYPVTVPIPRFDGPRVITLFDVQHLEMPEFFSRAERTYRRFAYDRAARQATLVITSSEHSRERAIELVGVDPGRVEVVPLGIDHERFRLDPADDDSALAGLDLPERFVVYPANLWPHKNHARLVAALARTSDRSLELVLTGQPYGRLDALMDEARRAGVSERVHHLGFVRSDALPALYRRARALVFPSVYEGFGAPPLEAMACGCPVASSPRASLGELLADAALTFDPEDPAAIAAAIDRVTGDKTLRERLRSAGLERAGRYTWEAAAAGHVAAYQRAGSSPSLMKRR